MAATARLVAIENDIAVVQSGARHSIDMLGKTGEFALTEVPGRHAEKPGALLWLDDLDPDLEIALQLDWEAGVANVDVTAGTPERVEVILDAFDQHCAYGDLDEHLALIRLNQPVEERDVVRLALVAQQRPGDPKVIELVEAALCDQRVELRRAGTFAVFALGWPALIPPFNAARLKEPSAELVTIMQNVAVRLTEES